MMILKLLIGLSIIVFIHELGHFLAAKLFGIKIEKFYLFFDIGGVKLFKLKHKNTEFGIGWFPLGGYVKLSGMIDESLDTKHLSSTPEEWEFRAKPAWQRIIVMSAGVIFNIILGIIIFWVLNINNHYIPNSELKDGVYVTKSGEELGFITGDKIIESNGRNIIIFSEISPLSIYKGKFKINRNGQIINIQIPDSVKFMDVMQNEYFNSTNYPPLIDSVISEGQAANIGIIKNDLITKLDSFNIHSYGDLKEALRLCIGKHVQININRRDTIIKLNVDLIKNKNLGVLIYSPIKFKKYNLFNSFKRGFNFSIEQLYANLIGFKLMLTGEIGKENITGPIGIAKLYGNDTSIKKFFQLTALISLIIGFMNILPIPGLDGGHIILTLIELVSGRKIPVKALEIIQIVGIVIILSLLVFSFYNDIYKLFN